MIPPVLPGPKYLGPRARLSHWRKIGASSAVLSWIRRGVPVEFTTGKPPPHYYHKSKPLDPVKKAWWEAEKVRLLASHAIERTDRADYVCKARLIPKKGGSFRLIMNLRPLNKSCVEHRCRYENLRLLQRIAKQGDWCFAVDLQDGYHHLAVRNEHKHYFTFNLEGELFCCPVLPFGWCNSPYYFVKFMRPFVQHMRSPASQSIRQSDSLAAHPPPRLSPSDIMVAAPSPGMGVLPWLDDFLFTAHTLHEASLGAAFVRTEMQLLGLCPHPVKTDWEPRQRREHLGFEVDFIDGVFRVPTSKARKASGVAKDLICRAKRSARWVPANLLAEFCGIAVSLKLAVPPALFFLRELYACLGAASAWPGHARLSKQALRDLAWWTAIPAKWQAGQIFRSPASHLLYSDASGSIGWGAVLDGVQVARGYWREHQRHAHITWKELFAVRLALQSFLPLVQGTTVRLGEDNTAALAAVLKLSSRSPAMMTELRKLFWLLDTHAITLDAFYVRSADNPADAPSRHEDRDDWKLAPRWFAWLQDRHGTFTVDRFATANNTHCQKFNSLHHDPLTEGVDAFAQDWSKDNNWINAPFGADTMLRVAQKLRLEGAAATVIAPFWPAQAWFRELSYLAQEVIHLPAQWGLFSQGRLGSCIPAAPPRWDVVVFRVPARRVMG